MTVLVVLAVLKSTLPSFCLSYKIQCQETTVTVLAVSAVVAVPVVTATLPLNSTPLFRDPEKKTGRDVPDVLGLAPSRPGTLSRHASQIPLYSGLKKTRPFRFLLLKSVVFDWFMVSSCLFSGRSPAKTLEVNARDRARIAKFKSDVLETPVILMPDLCAFCLSLFSSPYSGGSTEGGRNFTSCSRFSEPFSLAAKLAFQP